MATKRFIYSYNALSEGAKMMADALFAKRIKHKASRFKASQNKWIINWGSSEMPDQPLLCRVINLPAAVHNAASKSRSLLLMKNYNVRVPPFTFDRIEAEKWVENGDEVIARTLDKGRGGKGIVLLEQGMKVIEAPLYVRYIPKKEEWRVHVIFGKIVDIQKKLAPDPNAVANWKIRNFDNGFIFRRHGVRPPVQDVLIQAVRAVDALGLDFGAVDVIYNEKEEKAYVLEVNTAPGLEGQTIESYRVAFEEFFRENDG